MQVRTQVKRYNLVPEILIEIYSLIHILYMWNELKERMKWAGLGAGGMLTRRENEVDEWEGFETSRKVRR